MSDDDNDKERLPSFEGNTMLRKVTTAPVDDDIGEETTRRAVFAPSFNPTVDPVGFSTYRSAHDADSLGGAVDVRPGKAIQDRKPTAKSYYEPPIKSEGWRLSTVPSLPEFYPLERTAVFIPQSAPGEIAQRISGILRDLSIQATYDNTKAKVKCLTAENVDFRIRLYRGRNNYKHGIIVEVQRRFGFSVNFHSVTMAILDAAQGNPPIMPVRGDGLPLPTSLVSDSEDEYDDVSTPSLDFVSKMLRHPAHDSHNLALQTLAALTNPSKMGRKTAYKVSSAILSPQNEIGEKVIGMVIDPDKDAEETFGLRLMAMTTLSNAIEMISGKNPNRLLEHLRPEIMKGLREASVNPQMANLAARCLEPLIPYDQDPSELLDLLNAASNVGHSRHAALGEQADSCIRKIKAR